VIGFELLGTFEAERLMQPHGIVKGFNAFEYLTALQQHADEVAASPEGWLPWNYRDALSAISPAG
jgi:hypothetical protein